MTNDAAVAWYYEFGDTGEAGPVTFGGDPGREAIEWAERYGHTLHYLVPATTVAELRARVAELEANDRRYRFLRDGDGEVFWQDAYEAIGSAFVGSHIDSLIDEAMDRFKADQEDDSP